MNLSKFFLIFLFLVGCGPRSMEEYRRDGRESTKEMIESLRSVRSPRDFSRVESSLKEEFLHLAEIMIGAREHWLSHSHDDTPELTEEDRALSLQLKNELLRIQAMQGGTEFLATCQHEASSKVSLFEQRVKRKLVR